MVSFRYADTYGLEDLTEILALLRSEEGCPWDREQTHASIRRNMLEEAYEVAEAIDRGDPEHLKEELGDVLLQVVFHARMAQEVGAFTLGDVIDGLCRKLLFRHPHVFSGQKAPDAQSALTTWEAQKREEKGQTSLADGLDAVARSLPALVRAEKLQAKASKAGFDWREPGPALDKVAEELDELRAAAQKAGDAAEETGDLLFAAAKAGRFLGVAGEEALHTACEKFIARVRVAETLAQGVPFSEMDMPRLEALWREAKLRMT